MKNKITIRNIFEFKYLYISFLNNLKVKLKERKKINYSNKKKEINKEVVFEYNGI